MTFGLEQMEPVVQGIFFLVAVVLFVIAALVARLTPGWLVPAGLAFVSFVFMWNAFASA